MASTPTDTGLVKMKIFTFTTDKFEEDKKGDPAEFVLMFNPTTYTSKYEIQYNPGQAKGNTGATNKLSNVKPRDFSFEFIIDGTGVTGQVVDVSQKIEEFLKAAVYTVGAIHRPNYLRLNWGDLTLDTVLKSTDIAITLLSPQGKPLRAKISAVFAENISDPLRVRQDGHNSPDLTHLRQVKTDSKLPIMAVKEYRDHTYYLSVARANNLNNFRRLKLGSQIKLPPVSNEEKKG